MSNSTSTRLDDSLLGAATLDTGTSVRVVRADALDERERGEAAALLTAGEERWPALEVAVTAEEHLRWRLESPYGEHPGYVTLVRRDEGLTNLEWFTFRSFLVNGRGAVGAGPGESAGRASLDAGDRAQLRNLRDLIDGQFDAQMRFHATASSAWAELQGRAFELGNRVVTRTHVLDRHRYALERTEHDSTPLPARVIEASLLWPRAIAAVAGRTAVVASDLEIVAVDRFDERIDEFFVQAARPFALIGVRDAPYLNWRYCDERAGRFVRLVATEEGATAGYAVVRLAHDHAYLADLLTLPGRSDIVAALLRQVLEAGRAEGAMAIEAWLPSTHPDTDTYKRLGFFSEHSGPVVTVNVHGRGEPSALDFLRAPDASIHLTLGDSDRA
ncbi:MAG: hypothetical protein R3C39_06965 [Dehalococcoidia bacterium]